MYPGGLWGPGGEILSPAWLTKRLNSRFGSAALCFVLWEDFSGNLVSRLGSKTLTNKGAAFGTTVVNGRKFSTFGTSQSDAKEVSFTTGSTQYKTVLAVITGVTISRAYETISDGGLQDLIIGSSVNQNYYGRAWTRYTDNVISTSLPASGIHMIHATNDSSTSTSQKIGGYIGYNRTYGGGIAAALWLTTVISSSDAAATLQDMRKYFKF